MPQYRKKPVLVEAVQFHKDASPYPEGICLCGVIIDGQSMPGAPHIHTPEGSNIVSDGDWIITGVKGERYPCKPDIFEITYEPADKPAKIICLDGFRTLEDFKNGLKQLRPDWFSHTDAVGGDCCKATTETVKPS